ncbi:MAG: VacJ family lipoprotein, partial [Alphaproteobacteria bacterium]|nr:VacJ family lipoprotein [Alphaproteobacteria bacterium]
MRLGPALLAVLVLIATPLRAQVPPEVASAITVTVQNEHQTAAREMALAHRLGNPNLARQRLQQSHRRLQTDLATVVTAALSRHPGQAEAIMAAAGQAAPEVAGALRQTATARFPGLLRSTAPVVRAAPAQPVPVAEPVEPVEPANENDPLEGLNRTVFAFNDGLDIMVLRPLAAVSGFVVPRPAKAALARALANLGAPVIIINDVLQLELADAGTTAGRFVINSTIGLLGLFDMAEHLGLGRHGADFGQTLHAWGVGSGPYLMLPLLGPSTGRDGLGSAVDAVIDPFGYWFSRGATIARQGSQATSQREALLVSLHDLREGSVDYYAALRAAYFQNRAYALQDRQVLAGEGGGSETDLPPRFVPYPMLVCLPSVLRPGSAA